MPHPTSIKGVLIREGSVLLLLNERGEWDLPGGRPDPGEDHRTALRREVREEAGLVVEVSAAAVDDHLFEVLPGRFVRIVAYACTLEGGQPELSHEHLEQRWVPLAELDETIAGHPLPAGYLGAIRKASEAAG